MGDVSSSGAPEIILFVLMVMGLASFGGGISLLERTSLPQTLEEEKAFSEGFQFLLAGCALVVSVSALYGMFQVSATPSQAALILGITTGVVLRGPMNVRLSK